jgi:hypothetical protein
MRLPRWGGPDGLARVRDGRCAVSSTRATSRSWSRPGTGARPGPVRRAGALARRRGTGSRRMRFASASTTTCARSTSASAGTRSSGRPYRRGPAAADLPQARIRSRPSWRDHRAADRVRAGRGDPEADSRSAGPPLPAHRPPRPPLTRGPRGRGAGPPGVVRPGRGARPSTPDSALPAKWPPGGSTWTAPNHERAWARLRAIPGIGSWTVEMVALTGQGRLDVVPAGGPGIPQARREACATGNPYVRADEEGGPRNFFSRFRPVGRPGGGLPALARRWSAGWRPREARRGRPSAPTEPRPGRRPARLSLGVVTRSRSSTARSSPRPRGPSQVNDRLAPRLRPSEEQGGGGEAARTGPRVPRNSRVRMTPGCRQWCHDVPGVLPRGQRAGEQDVRQLRGAVRAPGRPAALLSSRPAAPRPR